MADLAPAQAVNLTTTAISRYADLVASAHGVTAASGWVDIDSLVTRLGGAIQVGSSDRAAVRIHHPGEFTINLPEFISRSRARLELAHGLGHYFLHYRYLGYSGEMSFTHGVRGRREVEANLFAAALLMPQEWFTTAWHHHLGDAWKVASRFEVSATAARVRALVLGLMG